MSTVLQQGHLQMVRQGQSIPDKVFAVVDAQSITLYREDPKIQPASVLGSYLLNRTASLVDGDQSRPRSFVIQTLDGTLEFACPTKAICSMWTKALTDAGGRAKPPTSQEVSLPPRPLPVMGHALNDASYASAYRSPVKIQPPPPANNLSLSVAQQARQPIDLKAAAAAAFRAMPPVPSSSHLLEPAARRRPPMQSVPRPQSGKPPSQMMNEAPAWMPGSYKGTSQHSRPTNAVSPQRARLAEPVPKSAMRSSSAPAAGRSVRVDGEEEDNMNEDLHYRPASKAQHLQKAAAAAQPPSWSAGHTKPANSRNASQTRPHPNLYHNADANRIMMTPQHHNRRSEMAAVDFSEDLVEQIDFDKFEEQYGISIDIDAADFDREAPDEADDPKHDGGHRYDQDEGYVLGDRELQAQLLYPKQQRKTTFSFVDNAQKTAQRSSPTMPRSRSAPVRSHRSGNSEKEFKAPPSRGSVKQFSQRQDVMEWSRRQAKQKQQPKAPLPAFRSRERSSFPSRSGGLNNTPTAPVQQRPAETLRSTSNVLNPKKSLTKAPKGLPGSFDDFLKAKGRQSTAAFAAKPAIGQRIEAPIRDRASGNLALPPSRLNIAASLEDPAAIKGLLTKAAHHSGLSPRHLQHASQEKTNRPPAAVDTVTDMAEWTRLTSWLESIGMEQYVDVMKEHGVTKISILELLSDSDLAQLGVQSLDIPIILRKCSELTQRIKSFSEEALVLPLSPRREALPVEINPRTIRRDLVKAFDSGDLDKFFSLWNGWLKRTSIGSALPEAMDTTDNQSELIATAKDALEFHLHLYFCVYPMKRKLSKGKVLHAKEALRRYLDAMTVRYDNQQLTEAQEEAMGSDGRSDSSTDEMLQLMSSSLHCSFWSEPLPKSRTFASLAGLVFVPYPQLNPAFTTLFKDEWTQGLRERLLQYMELAGVQSPEPAISPTEKLAETLLRPIDAMDPPLPVVLPSEDAKDNSKIICTSPASSISQLTDDTPLKVTQLLPMSVDALFKPRVQPAAAIAAPAVGASAGRKASPIAKSSALQAQVDQYNKLLRQQRMKTQLAATAPVASETPDSTPMNAMSASLPLSAAAHVSFKATAPSGNATVDVQDQVNRYRSLLQQSKQQPQPPPPPSKGEDPAPVDQEQGKGTLPTEEQKGDEERERKEVFTEDPSAVPMKRPCV